MPDGATTVRRCMMHAKKVLGLLVPGRKSVFEQVSTGHQTTGVDCGVYAVLYSGLEAKGKSTEEVVSSDMPPSWTNGRGRTAMREALRLVGAEWGSKKYSGII